MSDFLPPDPPSPPPPGAPPNTPPPGGGFGGAPPGGGGFGAPPPGGSGFGGAPPGGGYQPPPPAKMSSSTKGCLIAIAVLVGVFALCTCTAVGLVAFGIHKSPEARRAIGAAGDLYGLAQDGMTDPGAVAMVHAGCQQAVAFEFDRLMEIMREIEPENAADPGPDAPELIVSCSLQDASQTCDGLARVFVSAHVPPPQSFALTVQSFPAGQPVCANLYGPSGELIRALGADERFDVPAGPGAAPMQPPAEAPGEPPPPE